MDVYHYIPVECLGNFGDFKLHFNNLFCAGGNVLSQHRGVRMGGKLSSQLSSLFLMCEEMHNTDISLVGSAVFHTRYKDNIYVCRPLATVFPFMLLWCDALSTLYTIPVQVEGYGSAMDVLESIVRVTNKGLSMTVRCKTLELSERRSVGMCASNRYQRHCCGRTNQFACRLATTACRQSKLSEQQ